MSEMKSDASTRAGADKPAVNVRAITESDVAQVWELLNGLAEYEQLTEYVTGNADMLHDALFGPGDRLRGLVAERNDRIVGYALYYPVFSSFSARWRLWLEDLYIEPDSRGCGAGLAMMAALARIVKEGGYSMLGWDVLDWNKTARDFYERIGAHSIDLGWQEHHLDAEGIEELLARQPNA